MGPKKLLGGNLGEYGRPRLHPNGFIQLDLNPEGTLRLHVWPDKPLPKQKTDNPIHDHVFDMSSVVILGKLENIVYEFTPSPTGAYEMYSAKDLEAHNSTLMPTGERGDVREVSRGDKSPYVLGAFTFHDSRGHGLTATIMKKVKVYPGNASVLCPVGIPPDNSFDRYMPDEKLLWKYINKVVHIEN